MGGNVTDIAYNGGDFLAAIDPWNRLWLQKKVDFHFPGPWVNLGGFVRWPAILADSSGGDPLVAAVGGDNAIWTYRNMSGWTKPAITGNVGFLESDGFFAGYQVRMIQRTLEPYVCSNLDGSTYYPPKCEPLGGRMVSLSPQLEGDVRVGVGSDGRTYYKRPGEPWVDFT
jgi:hypothetical protein